ncbi:class II aldolase/adducin family protein [Aestuariivirga sp. YIM B02566]|uniref:class II aldolase/adducin family protein n=1 Tax=Taklimakanibacter albus TaxID=2800327 RepID=UPI00248512A4|nr:class II aldolase/adducin family protein [Aestuariivirga sp. YIM B02566]
MLDFGDKEALQTTCISSPFTRFDRIGTIRSKREGLYETRPATGAVVHLHATYATALSCLADIDAEDCVPPLTPYVIMRVGQVRLVPYVRPGDAKAGDLIRALGGCHSAVLLVNHGPVVAGKDIASAVYAAEELKETAKLLLFLRGMRTRLLTVEQMNELKSVFG